MELDNFIIRFFIAISFMECIIFIVFFPFLYLFINEMILYNIRENIIERMDDNISKLK